MRSTRGLLRFEVAPGAGALVVWRQAARVPTPFGRWLLERVASTMLDWPRIAFHRVEVTTDGLEVALMVDGHAPAKAQFTAVADALARELELSARRRGWIHGPLWARVTVSVDVGGWRSVVGSRESGASSQ
jgi:hypothetical protein